MRVWGGEGVLPAEGEEQAFKDQHWSCAAEDGEGLARHEAEGSPSHCCAQETLQHPLEANRGPCHSRTLESSAQEPKLRGSLLSPPIVPGKGERHD